MFSYFGLGQNTDASVTSATLGPSLTALLVIFTFLLGIKHWLLSYVQHKAKLKVHTRSPGVRRAAGPEPWVGTFFKCPKNLTFSDSAQLLVLNTHSALVS